MKTITLQELHFLITESFAVVVNDTLYFVGYDENNDPYVADNDGEDYLSLSEVDGDIEVLPNSFFFYINENPVELKLLVVRTNSLT